jgi:hypothetical protein
LWRDGIVLSEVQFNWSMTAQAAQPGLRNPVHAGTPSPFVWAGFKGQEMGRKATPKKTRFNVFKRDGFCWKLKPGEKHA